MIRNYRAAAVLLTAGLSFAVLQASPAAAATDDSTGNIQNTDTTSPSSDTDAEGIEFDVAEGRANAQYNFDTGKWHALVETDEGTRDVGEFETRKEAKKAARIAARNIPKSGVMDGSGCGGIVLC